MRRKAVGPSLHRAYLEVMLDRVFSASALHLNDKLAEAARTGRAVNIEASFSQARRSLPLRGRSRAENRSLTLPTSRTADAGRDRQGGVQLQL